MKTHVTFRSSHFAPNGEEWTHIESGRMHGQRLAEFVARELREKGFKTAEPLEEDWGWLVEIEYTQFRLWIGCGGYEHDDGFLCFIEPHQPVIRRFPWIRKIDTTSKVGALRECLDDILVQEPSVTDKQWWTYDELNRPNSKKRQ